MLTKAQSYVLQRILDGNLEYVHPRTLRSLRKRGLVESTLVGVLEITDKGREELEVYYTSTNGGSTP